MTDDKYTLRHGYHMREVINTGSYGIVHIAVKDNISFAAKEVPMGDDGIPQIIEIDIVKRCDHPNIIKFIDIFADQGTCKNEDKRAIYYIMPLADKTLLSYIHEGDIHDNEWNIIFQIISAVLFLHTNNICHGDLKPNNILMFGDTPVIADFGISHYLNSSNSCTPSPDYAPPEILITYSGYKDKFPLLSSRQYLLELKNKSKDKRKADVWSLGVIITFILNKCNIFDEPEGESFIIAMIDYLNNQDKYLADNSIKEENIPFIKQLLDPHPSSRVADLAKILKFPIFEGMNPIQCKIISKDTYRNTMRADHLETSINWMGEVCKRGGSSKCYILAIDLFYRCFDLVSKLYNKEFEMRTKLRIIMSACILISNKLENSEYFNINYLCGVSNNKFTSSELKYMELEIVLRLSGVLATNTIYNYCSKQSLFSAILLIKDRDTYIKTDFEEYIDDIELNIYDYSQNYV